MQLTQRQSTKAIQPKSEVFQCPEVLGARHSVPLLDGRYVPQIFMDNGASTKPFRVVSDFIREIESYYSNIHRGTGFDSNFCTERYEEARRIVGEFVGWDSERDVVIPVRNTTEGMNLLANTIQFAPGDRVLTTILEHHSNDLPWRKNAKVEHLPINSEGQIDLQELERRLDPSRGRVRVVSMTGASNILGSVLPIYEIAALAHKYGALMVVDGAQLVPHRRVNMRPHTDPGHIDFIVFSGHKMNSPAGVGAVVGRRDIFAASAPYQPGGGTVASVSTHSVTWAAPPDRNEAGTPNILGMLALARTIQVLEAVGMDKVEAHERHITSLLLQKLSGIPQVKILGSSDPEAMDNRVGVVTFTVEGVPHGLVAAILSYESGIAVRNGCFCAQPLMKRLLKVEETCTCPSEEEIVSGRGDRHNVPGAVRASLGIHNTEQEIETLVEAVSRIAQKQWQGDYEQDATTGDYLPRGFRFDFSFLPGFSTEPVIHCPAPTPAHERHLKAVNRLPLVTLAGIGALLTTIWACLG
jgi:selenocysteine lyase/cysteine desulfurase